MKGDVAVRAIVLTAGEGIEGMRVEERPAPEPSGSELLVEVGAAGLNRADVLQARGKYPATGDAPVDIPGLEFAGRVVGRGPRCVSGYEVGDRVMGLVSGGALAEYLVVDEGMVAGIPPALDDERAGVVPEACLTSWDALWNRAGVVPGQTVLIHAVAGGMGTSAVQIAKAMGCVTIGTTRSAWKREACRELGLDHGLDANGDWVSDVARITDGRGVSAVLDHVAGAAFGRDMEVLEPGGRIVVIGLLGGARVELDLRRLMEKRGTIVGTTLRARPLEEKRLLVRMFRQSVMPWLASGRVRPVVDRSYGMEEIGAAARRLESGEGMGRVVVRIREDGGGGGLH